MSKIKSFLSNLLSGGSSLDKYKKELSELATERVSGHTVVRAQAYKVSGVAVVFDNDYAITVASDSEVEREHASYELFFTGDDEDVPIDKVVMLGESRRISDTGEDAFIVVAFTDSDNQVLGGIVYNPIGDEAPKTPESSTVMLGSVHKTE